MKNIHLKAELGSGFQGAVLVSFESRETSKMADLIRRFEGVPVQAPSLQEIPLQNNPETLALGKRLISGEIDVLILMTGVGVRCLWDILAAHYDQEILLKVFRRVTTVTRGPKTAVALSALGVTPTLTVADPGTSKEILEILDTSAEGLGLEGKVVAVQEQSSGQETLIEGLKKRGARVIEVPVYRWALPENTAPLKEAIQTILAGQADGVFFTNSAQAQNVLRAASEMGWEPGLRQALKKCVVVSIGPSCSEKLRELGLPVDFEPDRPKMESAVEETASRFQLLQRSKKEEPVYVLQMRGSNTPEEKRRRHDSPFMKACRREASSVTPVWLMRQAGRYMKEYRALRARTGFLELCKNKDLCAEVTVFAQEKIGADAAILFSDILLIVEPFGLGLEYTRGDGPVISGSLDSAAHVDRLPEIDPQESLGFVMDAVKLIRSTLKPEIPLIGFSGAPFTLASYMIEGGSSKVFLETKRFMTSDPGAWHALMEKISRAVAKYLNAQIAAGADVVQLFDSWAGCLAPEDYREFVLPHTRSVIKAIKAGVPVIHFATGTGGYLPLMREAGGDVLGVDFRVPLDEAWRAIGHDRGIQGNLDPVLLCGPRDLLLKRAAAVLDQAEGRPGFIFNLGHGILPETPVENVQALIEFVHAYRR